MLPNSSDVASVKDISTQVPRLIVASRLDKLLNPVNVAVKDLTTLTQDKTKAKKANKVTKQVRAKAKQDQKRCATGESKPLKPEDWKHSPGELAVDRTVDMELADRKAGGDNYGAKIRAWCCAHGNSAGSARRCVA